MIPIPLQFLAVFLELDLTVSLANTLTSCFRPWARNPGEVLRPWNLRERALYN